MKPKKILALLVPLLVLALIVPASSYYEPMQDRSYGTEGDDHPWGGDDGGDDGGITGKGNEFTTMGPRFIVIDIIRIMFVPFPDYSGDEGSEDGMLPDCFDPSSDYRGDFGKGKK
jgi:hypothetical protein